MNVCWLRRVAPLFSLVSSNEDQESILLAFELAKKHLKTSVGKAMNPNNFVADEAGGIRVATVLAFGEEKLRLSWYVRGCP